MSGRFYSEEEGIEFSPLNGYYFLMKEIIFICGVNGVGKSSVIPYLALLLSSDEYDIRDFDERGVPENAGRAWRASETAYWLETGKRTLKDTDRLTIVCGYIKPIDFGTSLKNLGSTIQCVLLDANPDAIRQRLERRYTKNGFFDPRQRVIGKSVQEFIEGNIYIRNQLRHEFEALGCKIIDTSDLTPEEVAKSIVRLIQ